MPRVYVVTGSASGIGASTSGLLRKRGDVVIGVDVKGEGAEVVADLSTDSGRQEGAQAVLRMSGGVIDAVLVCHGSARPAPETMSVNYFGVTEFLGRLLPALSSADEPRAAVVSSVASLQANSCELVDTALAGDEARALEIAEGLMSDDPMTGYMIYTSSKRALSRWVRRESITGVWAGAGIPLNAVAPGTVVTPMTKDLLSTPEGKQMADAAVPMPLNYHQPPESIATLLVWLTSPDNTHLTGQVMYNDGGADVSLRGDDVWSWHDERL